MDKNPLSRRHPIGLAAAAVFTLLATGLAFSCSRQNQIPGLVPVSGRILLEGAPLLDIAVRLHPDASKGNTSPHLPVGYPDGSGRFEAKTNIFQGVAPGWYRVVVVGQAYEEVGPTFRAKPLPCASKYADEKTTDLRIEVKYGVPADSYDIHLTK